MRSEIVLRLLKLLETSRQSQVRISARVEAVTMAKEDSALRSGIRGNQSLKDLPLVAVVPVKGVLTAAVVVDVPLARTIVAVAVTGVTTSDL